MRGHINLTRALLASLGVAMALGVAVAEADVVTTPAPDGTLVLGLDSTATTAGTQTPATITGDGLNDGLGPVNVSDVTNNPASNYGFTNSFTGLANNYFSGTVQGYKYNFVDSYVVDVPAAQTSSYIFSLNLTAQLGIQDLSARLYDYSTGAYQNLTIGGTGAVNGPVAGPWSADQNGVVASTTLSADVTGGEYVLQLVGLQTGTTSGMYSGSLAVVPVPVPAGLPLMLSGLGGLGMWVRRRRQD